MVDVTHDFEAKLKEHIAAIEKTSAVEIVPVIVKRATGYATWALLYGLVLSFVPAQLIATKVPLWGEWVLLVDAVIWLGLGFLIAFFLKRVRVFAKLIPARDKQEAVSLAAESLFLGEAVFETRQRLGILIAVFEFEKSVIVLADRGFKDVVPKDYWAKLGQTLAADFSHHRPGDEFFEVLKEIEEQVAPKFKATDDKNELSNELRKR